MCLVCTGRCGKRAEKAGYDVAVVEVSAKKRIDGGEGRVIRQRKLQDGRIELSYSLFHTDIYSRA